MTEFETLGDTQEAMPRPGSAFMELREGRCKFPLGGIHDPPTPVWRVLGAQRARLLSIGSSIWDSGLFGGFW